MFRLTLKCIVIVAAALASLAQAADPGKNIVFDADFVKLRNQHARDWAAEDEALRQRLAQMRKKYGRPPNIIHIMWDDQSLGEVGIRQMNKVLGFDTPRINQMAQEGISFTRMYTEPSCTPTRTAALTGRIAARAGMHKVGFPPDGMGLHRDEVTIAEVLSKVGYETAFVGKAHQGDIEQSYMNNQGFDYANFSMYNQFPLMMWHKMLGAGGAVQGLFEFQWDKKYAIDQDFRPLGYVNQLEGRKGEKPRVFSGTSIGDYKKLLRTHQELVVDYLAEAAGKNEPFYLAYWPHVYDAVRKPEELTTSASTWYAQSVVVLERDVVEIMDK